MTVSREYDKIVFKRGVSKAKAPALEFVLSENETIMFGDHLIKCLKTKKNEGVNNSLNTFYISCDKIEEIPVVRARITGDKIKLRGRPEKSLKKLFIEQKIPADIRDFVPVIADRNRVLAVCGVGVDERVAARYREPAFCVTIVKGKTENAE